MFICVLCGFVVVFLLFFVVCLDFVLFSEEIVCLFVECGFDKFVCVSFILFKMFLVMFFDSFFGFGLVKGNVVVYDVLVGVGLLCCDGDFYDFMFVGCEDYKFELKVFCYSSGFDVSVCLVDFVKFDDYGLVVEKGWLVIVEVKLCEVKDWVKNFEVFKQVSLIIL